jgi:putative nucleotidyltransferase with HDIG domain
MTPVERARIHEELVRKLAAALRAAQLYAPTHPIVQRSTTALTETLKSAHESTPSIAVGIVGDDLVVGDLPIARASENFGELMRRIQQAEIQRIVIDRGVEASELVTLVRALARTDSGSSNKDLEKLPHIRVGRLEVEEGAESGPADIEAIKGLYQDAVGVAESLWNGAKVEGVPDPNAARSMIDSLAQAVAQNRTALLALTALKNYDNYTFTHMVNVSILTMGQARGLGMDGGVLRELGVAALMHDIGKVRTPSEILNKPDKLTDAEFDILKRHTVEGAEILRATPEMGTLAPIVAFEHHLRADGTGYPVGVVRSGLNLATTIVGIADVYDAMRSQRVYQEAFPTDRILAVLQRNHGQQFDQHLVRRFAQLVGIYPAGNVVRLTTGEIAVVLQTYAPDPHRPRVRLMVAPDGSKPPRQIDLNLWEEEHGRAIVAPVDPATVDFDPLSQL